MLCYRKPLTLANGFRQLAAMESNLSPCTRWKQSSAIQDLVEKLQKRLPPKDLRNNKNQGRRLPPTGGPAFKKREIPKVTNFEYRYDRSSLKFVEEKIVKPVEIESSETETDPQRPFRTNLKYGTNNGFSKTKTRNQESLKTAPEPQQTHAEGTWPDADDDPHRLDNSDDLNESKEPSLADLPIISYDDEDWEKKEYEKPYPEDIEVDMVLPVVITRIAKTYAIVQPAHYPASRGVLPGREIERDRYPIGVTDISQKYKVGDSILASVFEIREKDNTPLFSVRRVPPRLADSFQPEERDLQRIFEKYGTVLYVDVGMTCYSDTPHLRIASRVTMETMGQAQRAVKGLHLTDIPVTIGYETYYHRIGVSISHKPHTYREDVKKWLIRKHKADVIEWTMTPDDRRAQQRTDTLLGELIPGYYIEKNTLTHY